MSLRLNQQQQELVYSLFLILLIPAGVIASTIWLTGMVKSDFDQELQRKANLAAEIFDVSVAGALTANTTTDAAPVIQSEIDQTTRNAPEIALLTVSVPSGGGYKTLASSDTTRNNQADTAIQTQVAAAKLQPIASLIAAGEAGDREWLVASPVTDAANHLLAVTSIRVSLANSDSVIASTLRTSFITLSILLTVIVLLLLNHFRFVQYAELFRKQKELDQMKDDFISIATHELKAPMTIIKGYISMALEMKLPSEPTEMLRIAFNNTDRLGRLVTDLLDVSRIEQGRTKYTFAPIRLPEILAPMAENFQVKAREKQLALTYGPPADLPLVMADSDRVSEIFTNLIDNAIKYSRTGTVTVSHLVEPASIATIVEDTGIGMTLDEQGRLFERFYRARNDDTKDIAGTGLGLWIIKQYIEHMGGTIRVESEKQKGSRFIINLPRATPAAPQTD